MPSTYTPTTPTLLLCSNLADTVRTNWGTGASAPSGVDWDFCRRFGDGEDPLARLDGRQVVFFPSEYDWEGADRAEDAYTHHVACLVVERYTDAGDPPRDWVSQRVDFVHTQIVQALRFTRGGPPSWNRFLMTLAATVSVCDVEKLTAGGKLFYALVQLLFRELVTP